MWGNGKEKKVREAEEDGGIKKIARRVEGEKN